MFKKHQQTAIVLVVSILFFGIPFITSPDLQNNPSFFNSLIFYKRCIETLIIVVYFYLNYFLFVPYFYHKKKYLIFIAVSVVFLLIAVKLPDLIITNEQIHCALIAQNPDYKGRGPRPEMPFFMEFLIDKNAYQFYLALSIGILLKTNQYINGMQQDMLKSEVSYLKAQINPHFLFNTLNSLYALSLVKSDDAPNAILKLSSIMRYVVTESSKEKVSLKSELDYISDYIDLQKLRLTKNTQIDYQISGSVENQTIAPLLFIPIIENCFKYGVNQTENVVIKIHISVDNNEILLETFNKKVAKNISELEKTETGIINTQKRLDILYLNKYKLNIENTDTDYKVQLKINLK
ncbi:Histidine kinase [Paenimyroides ummariense]|uniref:Histidine kinase n=1 Tax=Paenimyroides ummariense TaxID=913024 RepID=A0A1I4YCP6_9FLAO|nr:sensor histidine kinase [Paenimyroides ummariense]SFN35370.1 Histidine kinase [Paenimyroides ummariense]